jgi:hypothetical protein
MMHAKLVVSVVASLSLWFSSSAFASVIYTYTGNFFDGFTPNFETASEFYSTENRVTASITFGAPLGADFVGIDLAPENFELRDETNTITPADSVFSRFSFATDASGLITAWDIVAFTAVPIVLGENGPSIGSIYDPSGIFQPGVPFPSLDIAQANVCAQIVSEDFCRTDFPNGNVIGKPGTWSVSRTDVSQVHAPAVGWLLLSGLAALGFVRRRETDEA